MTNPIVGNGPFGQAARRIIVEAFHTDDDKAEAYLTDMFSLIMSTKDVDDLERRHITATLTSARDDNWCYAVHDYLHAVWGATSAYAVTGIAPHVHGDTVFHFPDTGVGLPINERFCSQRHCMCGHECNETCRRHRYMAYPFGHRMHETDGNMSCLTCGAVYRVRTDEEWIGHLVNNAGMDASYCANRTDLVHGVERICEADNGRACSDSYGEDGVTGYPCSHTVHECNCILCED